MTFSMSFKAVSGIVKTAISQFKGRTTQASEEEQHTRSVRDIVRRLEGVRLSATHKESYSTRKKNFKRSQHQHSRTKVQDLQETVKL